MAMLICRFALLNGPRRTSFLIVSKAEIIAELPKLKPEERQELRLRLAELDRDDWVNEGELSDAEKVIIEQRFRDLEVNPSTSIPWEEAKARLLGCLKR